MFYPLKFEPILRSLVWGGDEICKFKDIYPIKDGIGECFELSSLEKFHSIVKNGNFQGKFLRELVTLYKERLLGNSIFERFGNTFPFSIKLIDAKKSLSIQVHPNDALAKQRHCSYGKSEMWYVVKASEDAFLYAGFQRDVISINQYTQSIKDHTLTNLLHKYKVQSGDVFYLPAGCVHAIGAGCFILEIHQTSDITYRIYDYDRKDSSGRLRPLHIELAQEAIDFQSNCSFFQNRKEKSSVSNLINCPYFTVNQIKEKKDNQIIRCHEDHFVVYVCLQGKVDLSDKFNHIITVQVGETILIPAINSQEISIFFKEKSKLLEIYIDNIEEKKEKS